MRSLENMFQFFIQKKILKKAWLLKTCKWQKNKGSFEDEGWRVRKDGTVFWADVIFTACYNEQHQLTGFAKVTRDISNQKKLKMTFHTWLWSKPVFINLIIKNYCFM